MNVNHQNFSKEAIRARMLQNATKLWGVKNIQSLDPFVKLLIDAFSTEAFKANNEIENINSRVLEKLAKLLTPSRYTHPSPAHAVALCMPGEDREILPEHTEFFLKKNLVALQKDRGDKQLNIGFTPVGSVNLVKARTAVFIAGGTAYSVDSELNKIPITKVTPNLEDFRTVYLGIDVSEYSSEIFPEKLSFYASNPTFEDIDFVYRLLPYVEVFVDGIPLQVTGGLSYLEKATPDGFEGIVQEQSVRFKIKEDIRRIYQNRFIEIEGIFPALFSKIESGIPHAFDDGSKTWEPYRNKKMLWLTLKFPPQFTAEILENFLFVTNAFPVYNRSWKKTDYALDIMGNNIPMQTDEDEYFLYVEEVADGKGRKYQEVLFTPSDRLEKGLYTVRKGGMERFSSRNAVDLMANLRELLRDEVAAFSVISRDKVKEALAEISEKMKGLMQRVDGADQYLREEVHYAIIEPVEESSHTFASFWVTNGQHANHLRPGTELTSQTRMQTLLLITSTTGGDRQQKQSDTIQAYKYALTTRDKIISVEDLKNYCRMVLTGPVQKIDVKRGTAISDKPKEGFVRTVDIEIVPEDYAFYGQKYWDSFAEILKNNIKARAIDGLEYRVRISEN